MMRFFVATTLLATGLLGQTAFADECGEKRAQEMQASKAQLDADRAACGVKDVACKAEASEKHSQRMYEANKDRQLCQINLKPLTPKLDTAPLTMEACRKRAEAARTAALTARLEAEKKCKHHEQSCMARAARAYEAKLTKIEADLDKCVSDVFNRTHKGDGGASENAPIDGGADEYGKVVPPWRGEASYGGVKLFVQSFENMRVKQGMAGRVAVVSKPAKYSWAQGVLTDSHTFSISQLWDLDGNPVKVGDGITVPVSPK